MIRLCCIISYTGELFVTFCLEHQEYMDFGDAFKVVGINDRAIWGGVGPAGDPISPLKAWLYTQFRNHTLSGYIGDATSANELQEAIWYIEGETNTINGQALTWYNQAVAAGWTDIHNVRVLNLERAVNAYGFHPGDRAQDQLVLVPEPYTFMFLGATLAGISVVARRRKRRA